MVNMNNNHMENLQYMKTNHAYKPDSIDDLSFDLMFENRYFETYNHTWYWTFVKRETLKQDASIIGIVKSKGQHLPILSQVLASKICLIEVILNQDPSDSMWR